MRIIKFRAQDIASNKWLFGDIRHHKNDVCIFEQGGNKGEQVKPKTVGQFTGLHDKNGKEIYEGDILRTPQKKDYDKENYVAYEVFWHDNDCASHHIGWQMNRCHFQGCICGTTYIPEFLPKTTATMEVVGNIHDNPELLGEKGDEQ